MIEVFVVSAARTAIGTFGGALKDYRPSRLAALAAAEAIRRAGIEPNSIEHAVFGQVIPTEPADAYIARVAAVHAGVPLGAPALTVNRLCGSGLQAVLSAAQMLMLGDADIALAGGVEVMSRAPFLAPQMRWGRRMGDAELVDALNGALTDPFGGMLMGVTAENVADRFGISRLDQDRLALESQRRAAAAIADGRFVEQIVAVPVKRRGREEWFAVDEHVRAECTLEDLGKLRPIFKDGGTVTAGNASGVNDGAAAVVLASAAAVARLNLKPLARLCAYGLAGVDPAYMGIGPIAASRRAMLRAGISVEDLDVIESNEAFAAPACAVTRQLQLDPARVNPNGSGISLGHPVGATGVIITTKLLYELQRIKARFGLATMCIGGGQGIAAIFERA
jgi:acetyl-CoA C-acetyltransferase